MSKALPKPVFAQFIRQVKGRQTLDKATADAIAHAVRIWATERGATHFTHWFQPQTGTTAEKHDCFLTLKSTHGPNGEDVHAIDSFSGTQLLQAEPDASSFPSGGMRTTFEARGYTVWDTTSPMFIQPGPHNTSILYIPSVFISYNGDALDEKTVLLRSSEAVSKAACRLLNLIKPVPAGVPPYVQRVYSTLGTEQEFFLIDRALYALRPDLKICGRALFGNLPPKHQQMEDHYFGQMPSRVIATLSETELESYKLGVPIKTRHNEVAPSQFEMAPIFEEASIAVDHNLITMEVLHKVAHRHNLKVLFHEKPFKGINGSGKHCNWSLSTDRGENLLDPTVKPETNYQFLLFLVAVLHAVHKHGGLLRTTISSASNDHRLGAAEAPPGIVSAFLGEQLSEVLDAVEEARPIKTFSRPHIQSVKLGGTSLDVKVASLPSITRDLTDRNRTSPFAFTGNKFEFRAVGSKQSPSFPVTVLNAAVASALNEITEELIKEKGDKPMVSDADKLNVIKKYIASTKPIRFERDNYSDEWVQEAERRGLPNLRNSPDAFEQLMTAESKKMLVEETGVFTESELNSRYHIMKERYAKDLIVEANTLKTLVQQQILPSTYEYRKELALGAKCMSDIGVDASAETSLLTDLSETLSGFHELIAELTEAVKDVESDEHEQAKKACKNLLPLMEKITTRTNKLEEAVADKHWALPKSTELLFY
ncbi:glutamine synthetase/guanido kinase [Basidiobolus meristosporus CBS 931.73]|uniref:Glutamine synthetase/guanido kinase n=2 Tax=Basidiobolus meristosporus CBS 931.73 TaxID=1314790 RepID=A0A1Y1XWT8_9FUNG|nr:glutamine synthetase/guanido kinase [Basidiobolus meristosporus CBS 931.73]|eukprot:ORX90231.1 glutamine synthetase/guanido kinase [Basidiobolus meristosporus CBS 931.73]